MIRGLYTSGYSMLANTKKMDVIANNLANADTTGFKKDLVIFQAFPENDTKRIHDYQTSFNPAPSIGSMRLGMDVGEVFTNFEPGSVVASGRNMDVAITNSDKAFFTIGVPNANGGVDKYYSRDGAFMLNAAGTLVNKDGYSVLGKNGPITLPDSNFIIRENGDIVDNGQIVNTLAMAQFNDTAQLTKYGNNLLTAAQGAQTSPFTGSLQQGYIEHSNVNTIKEMVEMITVTRAYETNQKLIQFQDATLDKVINEVGPVR